VKKKKYLPELTKSDNGSLSGEYGGKSKAIWVGPVAKKEKDLFSRKNLADYIDERGRMQLLKFFSNHQKPFPMLWILVQKEASRRLVEVGREWLCLFTSTHTPWGAQLRTTCNALKHCTECLC
jgi:hypothetical protein